MTHDSFKKLNSALGTYGRALLACLVAQVAVSGIPASTAELTKFGHAVWVAFLPVIMRALNPNDPTYGVNK